VRAEVDGVEKEDDVDRILGGEFGWGRVVLMCSTLSSEWTQD
jgi:hypothetical protein